MIVQDLIDGEKFEFVARSLGLVYFATHELKHKLYGISDLPIKVVVLSHNSDGCIVPPGTPLRDYDFEWRDIPYNVKCWFAQNVDVYDDRLIPIPIGLERDRWYPQLHKKEIILSTPQSDKKNLCYLNVNTEIRAQREALYQMFGDVPWCTAERGKNGIDFPHYARQLASHKFTFSPDGNGMDTHRTWEALYLGSFPIVQRHVFTEAFAELLPLLIVDDWGQVTEGFLNQKYTEFTNREWSWKALTMSYWESLIKEKLYGH